MGENDEPQYPPVEPFPSRTIDPTPQQDEPRQQRDLSRYSLDVEEASALFIQGSIPRSVRTMIRYCKQGELDCTKVDTERGFKYLIAPDSVHTRIAELQQITSYGHDVPRLDETRHDAPIGETWHDTTSHDATREADKKIEDLESRVGELVQENQELKDKTRDLEILNTVKDRVIERNEGMLATAHSQLMRFNRAVGQLTERLRLTAPKEDTAQIIAYLDEPTETTNQEPENFVDASNQPLR